MSEKPNILIIWGDDIGQSNLSCYSHGVMGYRTPNIDRIADEGALFTDYYGEQSCTAGRAAFITGQNPYRTERDRRAAAKHVLPIQLGAPLRAAGSSISVSSRTPIASLRMDCRPISRAMSACRSSTSSRRSMIPRGRPPCWYSIAISTATARWCSSGRTSCRRACSPARR